MLKISKTLALKISLILVFLCSFGRNGTSAANNANLLPLPIQNSSNSITIHLEQNQSTGPYRYLPERIGNFLKRLAFIQESDLITSEDLELFESLGLKTLLGILGDFGIPRSSSKKAKFFCWKLIFNLCPTVYPQSDLSQIFRMILNLEFVDEQPRELFFSNYQTIDFLKGDDLLDRMEMILEEFWIFEPSSITNDQIKLIAESINFSSEFLSIDFSKCKHLLEDENFAFLVGNVFAKILHSQDQENEDDGLYPELKFNLKSILIRKLPSNPLYDGKFVSLIKKFSQSLRSLQIVNSFASGFANVTFIEPIKFPNLTRLKLIGMDFISLAYFHFKNHPKYKIFQVPDCINPVDDEYFRIDIHSAPNVQFFLSFLTKNLHLTHLSIDPYYVFPEEELQKTIQGLRILEYLEFFPKQPIQQYFRPGSRITKLKFWNNSSMNGYNWIEMGECLKELEELEIWGDFLDIEFDVSFLNFISQSNLKILALPESNFVNSRACEEFFTSIVQMKSLKSLFLPMYIYREEKGPVLSDNFVGLYLNQIEVDSSMLMEEGSIFDNLPTGSGIKYLYLGLIIGEFELDEFEIQALKIKFPNLKILLLGEAHKEMKINQVTDFEIMLMDYCFGIELFLAEGPHIFFGDLNRFN